MQEAELQTHLEAVADRDPQSAVTRAPRSLPKPNLVRNPTSANYSKPLETEVPRNM